VWLRFEESTFTFEQARDRILAAAGALRDQEVDRGTRVVATTRNSPEYLFSWLAAMRLGSVLVPVNPKNSRVEIAGLIGQVDPHAIVTDGGLRGQVDDAAEMANSKARISLVEELPRAPSGEIEDRARPDDAAVMIPTSGTTGRSKLVVQRQRSYAMAGEGFPFWLGLGEDDRLMTSLPLFHVNAPCYSVLGSVAARAGLILLPRFSASGFIDSARRFGATEFNAIGAMLEMLMRQPERDDDADNPLRLCYTGPSPPRERQIEIERRFGLEIVCGYALSESPYGLIWRRGTRPFGTLGSARQHPTLGVINHARAVIDGRAATAGEVGELELSNPAVMIGYYGMPEETERVKVDGWLRTGDLVKVNGDGTYTFVGRKKELIRRRGENLSPVEVEGVLESHPAVVEAAVIGVPSDLSEEEVKAYVVLADDARVSPIELRDFVAARLAPFKVPRYFETLEKLPHTPTGRIAKHELSVERSAVEHDLEAQPSGGAAP
jgi:crotonobetaine/carnitine-CoA ligase